MRHLFLSVAALFMAVSLRAEGPVTIAVRTAGLERHDGFLPYYWDAAKGQLLLEVSRPGQELLYGAGIAGGAGVIDVFLDRGQLGDLGLCRFERVVVIESNDSAKISVDNRKRHVSARFPAIVRSVERKREKPRRHQKPGSSTRPRAEKRGFHRRIRRFPVLHNAAFKPL